MSLIGGLRDKLSDLPRLPGLPGAAGHGAPRGLEGPLGLGGLPNPGHHGPELGNAPGSSNSYPAAHGREEVPVNIARQLHTPGNAPAPPGLPAPPGPVAHLEQQIVALPGSLSNALNGNPAAVAQNLSAAAQTPAAAATTMLPAMQAQAALAQTLAAPAMASTASAPLPATVNPLAATAGNAQAALSATTMQSPAAATPPRLESMGLLERLTAALRMHGPSSSVAAVANLPATSATQALTATGLPLAMAASTQPPPVDARGLPLAINDRAQQVARSDAAMIQGYTSEGLQRRPMRRGVGPLLATPMSRRLMALGAGGNPLARTQGEVRNQAQRERATQWLFWVLAIVAYGCVAMAMVGLLAEGGGRGDVFKALGGSRSDSVGFASVGLVAGGIAWWLARRLARGGAQ
ncbi:MAG: hypothetical protein ACREO8_12560 [Luteimonas sp.]